jgi:AraC-like DNA-binding protein
MKPVVTVTARHLGMLVDFGARRGLDAAAFLARHHVKRELLTDNESRVPNEVFAAAWREIPELIGAPHFGLEVAQMAIERPPHNAFALLMYAARSSPNLGAAYATAIRFIRIVHDGAAVQFDPAGRLYLRPPIPVDIPPHAQDFLLATLLFMGRRLAGFDWNPEVVRFEHAAPADTAPYARVFRAPLRFDQSLCEIAFPRAILERPVVGSDPALHAVLEQHAEALLTRLPQTKRISDRVRQVVFARVAAETPDLDDVARTFGMSGRSLQRLLRAEGLTFRAVVDEVRRDLAISHMDAGRLSVPEIAFVLGFSDATAFHRAFRRWTGGAPGRYRSMRQPPGALA